MLKLMERAVLSRVLPKTQVAAQARCIPFQECVWCGGSAYRKVCHTFDCQELSSGCRIPCPQLCI